MMMMMMIMMMMTLMTFMTMMMQSLRLRTSSECERARERAEREEARPVERCRNLIMMLVIVKFSDARWLQQSIVV